MNGSRFTLVRRSLAALIFLLTWLLYVVTAEPTVSYWDCPEYVTTAMRLEPGHPPGNPMWTLTARFFTLFAPTAARGAFAVNVMSGFCSAIAGMLLFLTLTILIPKLLPGRGQRYHHCFVTFAGAFVGAATLAVSDTFWFSAVEAEVYAMSVMLTALVIWLTFVWGEHRDTPGAERYLLLVAYITGLSIGVHQLNLLVLPCLALIVLFYRYKELHKGVYILALAGSLLIIAAVLFGMMPGVLAGAAALELRMVNMLHLPLHSGVITYCFLTLAALIVAVTLSSAPGRRRWATAIAAAIAFWLSGLFSFGGHIVLGLLLSAAISAAWIIFQRRLPARLLNLALWSATFLFIGYSSYALILIRGAASPPMNQGAPSDIFALTSYLNREQYGAAPLIYGKTPYSTPLYREDMISDSTAVYTSFARTSGQESYAASRDSAGRDYYRLAPSPDRLIYTPELNMWFPRIHSSSPDDIESYRGWVGLDSASMTEVETSFALDSAGNAVGRLVDGHRVKEKRLRPTYLQNLMMLGGYQTSYMYMRYLLWNFVGRQNDVYGQGEADAGNFITGIPPVDALMLQHPELLPADIGSGNPGHHVYWLLPLLLGVTGITLQLTRGKRGRRQFAVIMLLFLLTGLAIVFYLNQTPGQPRERDYSFVGSFYAFCIWIGLGAAWIFHVGVRLISEQKKIWYPLEAVVMILICVAEPVIMAIENYPDHDRSGRTATRDFALNILNPLPHGAILFVNGDNFTFPLWYLHQVEGVRPDVTIVNLAYLGTPWYLPQLAISTPGAPGLRLSVPASRLNRVDLAPFAVADIGYGEADAANALRDLFAQTPAPDTRPRINASRLRFPWPGTNDSVTVDLRKFSGGHSYLRLSHLAILDIMASNNGRPIMWHSALRPQAPLDMPAEGLNLRFGKIPGDSLHVNAGIFLNQFRGGGLAQGAYIDIPGRQQTRMQRHAIASTALALARRNAPGDVPVARSLLKLSQTMFPPSAVQYTTLTDNGTPYSEALELAEAYNIISRAGDIWYRLTHRDDLYEAIRLVYYERKRTGAYATYINSLSPRYRTYTKGSTRLSAKADSTARAMMRSQQPYSRRAPGYSDR